MFIGCSETNISGIVKHVQHIEIIRAFCLSWGGLVAWGTEELASGISTPADTMMFFKDASGNTKYATMALDN